MLLTDPPYGIGENSARVASRGKRAVPIDYGTFNWDATPPSTELINDLRDKCDQQIIWGGNYFDLPPSSCWLVWDKDNGSNDFADCELAWTNARSAVRRIKYLWSGMRQQDMRQKEKRVHPTQKPLALMLWCLEQRPKTKTVFDPFCGSGTTLVAAKQLGIKAIGIERDERYCAAAVERLKTNQMRLSI